MILPPPDTISHYECRRCGHKLDVTYFHRRYGHMFQHSLVYCRTECWNVVETMQLEIVACYAAVLHRLTIPIPAGRRMIQL